MSKRLIVITLSIVFAAIAYIYRGEIKALLSGRKLTANKQEVKLLLKEDPTISSLATILVENGVLNSESDFIQEAGKLNLSDNQLDAGKYVILSGTRLDELVNGFVRGENGHGKAEVKVRLIFNRCERIEDIGKNVSACISTDSNSLVSYIYSAACLQKYGFNQETIPALFLPDEYEIYFDTDASEFVEFMAKEYREFWTIERLAKCKEVGLKSASEAATLASIVYAEQGKVSEEWPIIASLYLNRLQDGMKLQSDPTFKFCWGNELENVNRLLAKHRNKDCAYNTYLYEGLPPGPIRIVPRTVIEAVLNPAKTNYLFMCAKPDLSGQHNFTASGTEHMRNAKVYQKWLSENF